MISVHCFKVISCIDSNLKDNKLVFKTIYRLMQIKSIAECSRGAFCISALHLTFIKLPFVIQIFVLSIFELPLYTGFTVNIRTGYVWNFIKGLYVSH